jgi:DNA-binding transcriptional MerR regulator
MEKMDSAEFANALGVIPDTVRRWERSGKITPERTVGGHRRYSEKDEMKERAEKFLSRL